MNKRNGFLVSIVWMIALLTITSAHAVKRDPECDVEKAAKGAVMNATIGFGGRCSPADTAKDMTKDAVGKDEEDKSKKKKIKKNR